MRETLVEKESASASFSEPILFLAFATNTTANQFHRTRSRTHLRAQNFLNKDQNKSIGK